MTEKQVMAEVKYPFDRAELLALGEELARATDEVGEIEDRKKLVMADLSADLKRANNHISALARKIKDKYEFREVQCTVVYGVPRAGMKMIRPIDTRLEEYSEPMTADEMQQGLDFEGAAEGTPHG